MNWLGYFVLFTLFNYFKGQDPGLILVYFIMLFIQHNISAMIIYNLKAYAMAILDNYSLLQHCTVCMTWTQLTRLILYQGTTLCLSIGPSLNINLAKLYFKCLVNKVELYNRLLTYQAIPNLQVYHLIFIGPIPSLFWLTLILLVDYLATESC